MKPAFASCRLEPAPLQAQQQQQQQCWERVAPPDAMPCSTTLKRPGKGAAEKKSKRGYTTSKIWLYE